MIKKSIALFCAVILALTAFLTSLNAFAEGEENLVRGLGYYISTGAPTDHSYMNYIEDGQSFFVDNGQLTDGLYATESAGDGKWFNTFRSQSCIITFELENAYAVSSVKAGFLNSKNSGIYAPRYIRVYLSEDESSFKKVIDKATGFDLTAEENVKYTFESAFDATYKAKSIVFEFCSDIFAACDEIEIFGKTELSGNEKAVVPDKEAPETDYFKSLAGASDIIKFYNGYYPDDQTLATLTEDMMLPYIAYIDGDGEIKDTMFDAAAFVPCHTDYPSGGRLVKTNGIPGAVMSDWEYYYDLTFRQDQDLHALDNVVGRVYGELGINGKFKVFLTLPFPTVLENKPFGDIDGDGIEEECKTLSDREDILKWYILKCIKGFSDAEFKNIELVGFYWYREEINYSESDHEKELIKDITDYVRKKRLVTLFDPFYLSVGYDHWKELGFDGAVMQPNYAFDARDYFEKEMLPEYAVAAKKANIGTEIETEGRDKFNASNYLYYGRKYESYLYYGKTEGYMNALKTYYQGAGPGSFYDFCYADKNTTRGIYLRRLYDITYKFIKGNYENEPPKLEAGDFEVDKNEKRNIEIIVTDEDSYTEDLEIIFPNEPAHGKVSASVTRKTLIYIPDKDYVGEDSFTVVATDGFGYSEPIEINVKINEPAGVDTGISHGTAANDESLSHDGEENNKDIPVFIYIIFGILGALIIIVAIAVILKHSKSKKN